MTSIRTRFQNLLQQKTSLVVLWLAIGWFTVYPLARPWGNALSWDVFGYYLYTPARFLWNDPYLENFSRVEEINAKYDCTPTFYQGQFTEREGRPKRFMIKYTMGVSLLESPFFLGAHLLAPALGYPQDGFSPPYNYAMIIASFCWVIVGLIFMRKVLRHFFSERLTALLLLILIAGTNYYITVLHIPGLTHTFEFSIFAIILWLTIRWHEVPSLKNASLLGLFIGLAILVRPTDGLILLVPLLWGVKGFSSLREKFARIFRQQKMQLLFMMGACFLAGLPQLLYWRVVAGHWFLFSYSNNPGEGFEFLSPYTLEVLFSFRKGWLVYTPVMLFALSGLYFTWKKERGLFWAITLFFIGNLYVVSSWSCWWYAGSFGQRALVESYAVMLIPLGFTLREAGRAARGWKMATTVLVTCFLLLNLFQSWQYMAGIIDPGRMTAAYYFHVFGRTDPTGPLDQELLLVDRSTSDVEVFSDSAKYVSRILHTEGYETPAPNLDKQYADSVRHGGQKSFRLDTVWIFSPVFEMPYREITKKDHAWIKCSFWYYPTGPMDGNKLAMSFCFSHGEGQYYKYFAAELEHRVKDAKPGQWNYYQLYYMTPEVRNLDDKLRVGFWLRGRDAVFVDDLKVEAFERKD